MPRLRKYAPLVAALTLLALYTGAAFATRSADPPNPTLAIEVPMKNGPFHVPAAAPGRWVAAHIRVPSVDSTKPLSEQVTAVKLMPRMADGKVAVEVYALYGDLTGIKSCDDWKQLKSTFVGKYVGGDGEEISINDLGKLGVSFGEKPLSLNVVPSKYAPAPAAAQVFGCQCGGCGALTCCPANGKCLRCGDCGDVCCGIGG